MEKSIVEFYNNQGYVHLKKYFDDELIQAYNDAIDRILRDQNATNNGEMFDESKTGKIKQIQYLHRKDYIFQELVERLTPIAQELTGAKDFKILNVQLFEKHPGISKPTRSHQDNAYFKMTPATPLTVWIPLDNIDGENGALYYAPKTHLTATRNHVRYHPHTTFRVRSGVPGLSLCLKEHPESTDLLMPTKKGDLLIHHCNLIHRAGRNLSVNRRRRAIGVVFIPKSCRNDPRLLAHHKKQLKEDIELQRIKDPKLYEQLKQKYAYLYRF